MAAVPFDSLVVMVEPKEYTFNETTAQDNHFQHRPEDVTASNERILQEHRNAVETLRRHGVNVLRVTWADNEGDNKPDSIFPNNSFSLHAAGSVAAAKARLAKSNSTDELALASDPRALAVLYPMSKGRRDELPQKFLDALRVARDEGLLANIQDLRALSEDGSTALEGTGAVVFGLAGDAAFVSCSQRADASLAERVLREEFGLAGPNQVFLFDSVDKNGAPVYHTNVVGWSGTRAAGWCFEAMTFRRPEQREAMMHYYAAHRIRVVSLSKEEMYGMAGNAIEVSVRGSPRLVMSETAWKTLSTANKSVLVEAYEGEEHIIRLPIPTIELVGGGSARCLMAESRIPPPVAERLCQLVQL